MSGCTCDVLAVLWTVGAVYFVCHLCVCCVPVWDFYCVECLCVMCKEVCLHVVSAECCVVSTLCDM